MPNHTAIAQHTANEQAYEEAKTGLQSAVEALEDIEYRLNTGDVSAVGLRAVAEMNIQDWKRVVGAIEKAVARSARALPSDDTTLAELLAPILHARTTVEPKVSTSTPDWSHKPSLPALVVVQPREHTADLIEGRVSGRVSLYYARTPLHAPLDPEVVVRACEAAGQRVQLRSDSTSSENVGEVDRVDLEVTSGFLPVPVIARNPDDGFRLTWATDAIASRVVEGTYFASNLKTGVHVGAGATGQSTASVRAKVTQLRRLDDREVKGIRHREVEVDIHVEAARSTGVPVDLPYLINRVNAVVDGLPGSFSSGIGVVSRAKVVTTDPVTNRQVLATVRVTYVSRLPQ